MKNSRVLYLTLAAFGVVAFALFSRYAQVFDHQRELDMPPGSVDVDTGSSFQNAKTSKPGFAASSNNEENQVKDIDSTWSFSDELRPKKYLVYSCSGKSPCGGWGDRLRGMFSTYVMALLTNRTFIINMTSPCSLETWLRPNEVLWNAEVDPASRLDEMFVGVYNNVRFADMLKIIDLPKLFKNDVVKVTPNFDLVSRLKLNPRYQKFFSKLETPSLLRPASLVAEFYRRLFTMNQDLQANISRFVTRLYENGKRRALICAQIRMGRNPSIPFDTEVRMTEHDLKAIWKFLNEYKLDSRYKIFVTTDSDDVKQEAKFLFPEQILETSGPITHPDYDKGEKGCDGLRKVILDQYLLKFCDTLLISKSVFGIIGAHLRANNKNFYQINNGTISKKTLSAFQLFSI